MRRALAVAALVALALPAVAQAHARVVRTTPAKGEIVKVQPRQVTFFFNERVEASFGVLRVFDRNGNEVQQGSAFRPEGEKNALAVALAPGLPQGTYTATYRVIAADAHPTKGGFPFSIGKPSPGGALKISSLPGQSSAGRGTRYAFGIDRWLGYGAIAVAVGGLFFLVWAWRPALARRAKEGDDWEPAARAFDSRLRLLLGVAVVTGIVVSLLALPLEGASATGVSFWSAWGSGVMSDVANTRFGSLMLLRAGAWALLGVILVAAAMLGKGRQRTTTSPELIALAMLPIGSLLISPALAGHSRTQDPVWVLFPADAVHLTAMSLWVGGLVMLLAAVPSGAGAISRIALTRFSTSALVAVVAISVSGATQAVFEVGSIPNLVQTGYGRAVLLKSILFLAVLGVAFMNRRRLIPALELAAGGAERIARSIASNVRVELALVAVVLAVTSVLVAFVPPTDSSFAQQAAPARRAAGTAPIGDTVALRYTVDPARKGQNLLNVYLVNVATGKPYSSALGVEASLDGPGGSNVPAAELQAISGSHYANSALQLDKTGTWTVNISVRTPTDVESGAFSFDVS